MFCVAAGVSVCLCAHVCVHVCVCVPAGKRDREEEGDRWEKERGIHCVPRVSHRSEFHKEYKLSNDQRNCLAFSLYQ